MAVRRRGELRIQDDGRMQHGSWRTVCSPVQVLPAPFCQAHVTDGGQKTALGALKKTKNKESFQQHNSLTEEIFLQHGKFIFPHILGVCVCV